MAVNYGQVAIVPKGAWNAETQYKVNNLVSYDGSSYVAKVQPPVGTLPTDTSYWQVSAAGTKKATADSLGTVMPDGTTTSVGEDGKLSVNTAQQDALGVVKGSDDITVGEDGTLTVNTTFEQATELANIIAGEAIKSVLGKVSKAIATTMSLDENALLKNMISGIDVNDSNKVPSSAYIHTLVERIGMGTELVSGLGDLTTGLNTVNNNLSNKSGFRKVIIDDTSATDREDLLKKKAKLIYDNQLGDGFYALVGGWAGKGYGFGIAEITAGKIMFLYMLMDTTYKCICDNLSTQSNFVYNQEGIIKAADFFKWNEVEISLPSLAANNGEVYGSVYTIPESYFENGKWTTAAMCGFSLSGTGYTSCTITMCKIIDNSIQYSVRNMGSAALSDIKLKVFIMFARI